MAEHEQEILLRGQVIIPASPRLEVAKGQMKDLMAREEILSAELERVRGHIRIIHSFITSIDPQPLQPWLPIELPEINSNPNFQSTKKL
jgi:hypothetical protein